MDFNTLNQSKVMDKPDRNKRIKVVTCEEIDSVALKNKSRGACIVLSIILLSFHDSQLLIAYHVFKAFLL